jgi:hypothetical protein
MPAWLTIVLAVVGVLAPLVIWPLRIGKSLQKLDSVQEDVAELKALMPDCQKERRAQENELHGRVTEIAKVQAANVARTDGVINRVERVEKKVFNGSALA